VRRATAAFGLCPIVLALVLAGCSGGGATATPAPATAPPATARATNGLPPAPTLPPTPPTATVARATPATPTVAPAAGTATRGTAAVATRRTITVTPPPAPAGEVPAGWKIYRGRLPFVIAYPPDWTVDEGQIDQGLVYFYAPTPGRDTFLVIATTGRPEDDPNLDVLRDRWFQSRTRQCDRFAVEATRQETHAGVEFATVGATCDLAAGLAYSYTGIGLRGRVPWIFELNAPYGVYDVALSEAFAPMLATWNIYDLAR
jgi:hypothetical protein